jgi:hypothetical protein
MESGIAPFLEYGIVAFGQGGEECDSACCSDMSCSSECPVKSACFGLRFYDDTAPSWEITSDAEGPNIGGDIVKLTISNFPYDDVSVYFTFESRAEQIFVDDDQWDYFASGSNSKKIVINTPDFGEMSSDATVRFFVEPRADPSKKISFEYLVRHVQPAIVSLNPSNGIPGRKVMLAIEYFDYKTGVFIRLNSSDPVDDDKVEVMGISNKHLTRIKFEWPGPFSLPLTFKFCPGHSNLILVKCLLLIPMTSTLSSSTGSEEFNLMNTPVL